MVQKILAVLMFAVMLTACVTETAENNSISVSESAEITEDVVLTYEQISAEDAKKLMDTASDYIIVDARTTEEFAEGHIPAPAAPPNGFCRRAVPIPASPAAADIAVPER